MIVFVVGGVEVRDHEEGALLEEDHFVGADGGAEALKAEFKLDDVGQQDGHDLRPGLVEGLVPDGRPEALCLVLEVVGGGLHDSHHFLVKHLVSHVFSDEVHFVDEHEYLGVLAEICQRTQAVNVVLQVDLELLGGHIEDENEHAHVLKDVVSLRLKVLLHEPVLPAAIPE